MTALDAYNYDIAVKKEHLRFFISICIGGLIGIGMFFILTRRPDMSPMRGLFFLTALFAMVGGATETTIQYIYNYKKYGVA